MSTIIDGSAGVTTNVGAVYNGIQTYTAQASTSGTSIDFTSIPSWVKRITVMFNGVSTSGTSPIQIQIGSGSPTTTGYVSTSARLQDSSAVSVGSATTGFYINTGAAANVLYGAMQIVNVTSNVWVEQAVFAATTAATYSITSSGYVSLSGTLDRLRITTVGGTETFDAGSINILYE